MKISATVSALVLTALASTSGTEALSGGRRSVQLNNSNNVAAGSSANLVKRVSLAQMKEATEMKKVKRQPLANAAPIAAAAGFGSIPSMNDGNMPIFGLTKRQDSFGAHNGKQGSALASKNSVVVSNASKSKTGSSTTTSSNTSTSDSTSDDTDADAEECEEEDDADAEDCEEDDGEDDEDCEEDDSADADAEDCEEEDDGDEEEDCEEETDDSTTSASDSSSSDDSSVTANVNVNLKQSNSNTNGNKDNSASSSSTSKNNMQSTRAWSSSAAASKTSSSAKSEATESSASQDGDSYTGTATWYTQNGNAGACGTVNPDSARIIALYTSAYANGDNCGRSVVIKNLDDGTQTTATVADMCPSCGGPEDIDLSVGAFEAIDPQYQTHGVRNIEWYFTD